MPADAEIHHVHAVVPVPRDPVFHHVRLDHELRRHQRAAHGLCRRAHRASARRPCADQRPAEHAHGRLLRLGQRRRRHGVQAARARDGKARLRQGLFRRDHGGVLVRHAHHPARDQPHRLRSDRRRIRRSALCCRLHPRPAYGCDADDRRGDHRQKARLRAVPSPPCDARRDRPAGAQVLLGAVFPAGHHHGHALRQSSRRRKPAVWACSTA